MQSNIAHIKLTDGEIKVGQYAEYGISGELFDDFIDIGINKSAFREDKNNTHRNSALEEIFTDPKSEVESSAGVTINRKNSPIGRYSSHNISEDYNIILYGVDGYLGGGGTLEIGINVNNVADLAKYVKSKFFIGE